MTLGLVILLISVFGYASNWLNWHFLNHALTRYLYYIGACVHESSHALFCLITGATITEFSVISSQPHVTHEESKLPIIGNALISSAPIFGGLFFLFLVNHYALSDQFSISASANLHDTLMYAFSLLAEINLLAWQSWVMLLLFINVGAMLGPSFKDIRNIWPILILLFFIPSNIISAPLIALSMTALGLIMVGIIVQITAIICVKIFAWL
jgi:Peptidase M50B-like